MEKLHLIACLLVSACLSTFARSSVSNCCEGDVLLLLDSCSRVNSPEFSKLLHFLSDLLRPFLLGRGQVMVGLVQVGTKPRLEFALDAYNTQNALQEALKRTQQLSGDRNTEEALQLALKILRNDGQAEAPPRILLWLTDGEEPGEVEGPMAALRQQGVSVLVVSVGAGNYQILRNIVTPPTETHLYFVDVDDIIIITEDLREAIIQLLRAERLQVRDIRSGSAVLQWQPVLSGGLGSYEIRYAPDPSNGTTDVSIESEIKVIVPGDFSWTEFNNLQPDTIYTARLVPKTNIHNVKTLFVTFRTLPELFGPDTVTVSDLGPERLRVRWHPLQPQQVQQYRVEYGAIPSGPLRAVTLSSNQSSALLKRLQRHTEYLITVTALHSSGQQRAMSIKACTQEVTPALTDLQLSPAGRSGVHVEWEGGGEGLLGYWVSWKKKDWPSSSSLFLPPHSRSTLLSDPDVSSRVCVSPVYQTARGEGLCCTANT